MLHLRLVMSVIACARELSRSINSKELVMANPAHVLPKAKR